MRLASTYRGARRNAASTPAQGRSRFFGWNAWEQANVTAKLDNRAAQVNAAREAASKAIVEARIGDMHTVANIAFLKFYRGEPRTRAVTRIIRSLEKVIPKNVSIAA